MKNSWNSYSRFAYIAILVIGGLMSCSVEPPPELPQTGAIQDGRSSDAPLEKKENLEPEKTLSFRLNILPMLSSNKTGRVFKCTTCHPAYTQSETLKIPGKIAAIVQEVQPEGRMPPNGDKFSPSDIQLLLDWQKQGFPE